MQVVIATYPATVATTKSAVVASVCTAHRASIAPRILTALREEVAAHQNASQETNLASGIPATPGLTARVTR